MDSEIKRHLKRLEASFQGETWYGESVMEKLEALDPAVVNLSPTAESNTVANIVQHMLCWRTFAVEKMKGNELYDIVLNSESDWPNKPIQTAEEWGNLLDAFRKVQQELLQVLETKASSFLMERVPGREHNYDFLLEGIVQHDVYHLGQVGIIAKQCIQKKQNSST